MTSQGEILPDRADRVRVLWLIKGLGPGGAERLVAASARLHDRGRFQCRVAYLLPWKDMLVEQIRGCGMETTCLGSTGSTDLRWMRRLRRLLDTECVDVLHVHSPVAAVGARAVLRTMPARTRPRLVYTEHNVWESHTALTRLANRCTAHLDDARLAVSGAVRASMPERLRATTVVVRHGVDVEAVRAEGRARAEVRRSFGFAPDDVVIGTVANLRPTKAYPDLLEAARQVASDVPNVRFVAVGQGPQEAELRRLHARLQLGDRFLLLGYRTDAVRVMSSFDVFCLASRHEGLPLALMEAVALGLPVVTTDVGGIRELVVDGEDAIFVPAGRPDELAQALKRIAGDPMERARMARTAKRRGDDIDAERAVRQMETLYTQLARR